MNEADKKDMLELMMTMIAPKVKEECNNDSIKVIFVDKTELCKIKDEQDPETDEFVTIGMIARYCVDKGKTVVFTPNKTRILKEITDDEQT